MSDIDSKVETGSRQQVNIQRLLTWLAAGVALFHIWANTFGNISDLWRNSLHLGLLGFLGFIQYPVFKEKRRKCFIVTRLVPALLIFSTSIYLILFENALHARNEVPVFSDLIFSAVAIILALELTRRTSGYVIPVLSIILLAYVLWWGAYVGGIFHFRGMTYTRVLYRMFFTDEGLFGMIATISSTYIFMFILFAAFLLKSGGGDFIINLARSLTYKITGGTGLVAVMASGLMGTISGSAVANTVSTGSITIPMMIKTGFTPRFAAAVETAASTGGQLMPPIMGAGAFIMAQWTQIPYSAIISAAIMPAFLYFASICFYIFFEAKKYVIGGDVTNNDVKISRVIREGVHFFIPIIILVSMLIAGFTPTYTAAFSILAVIISSWFNRKHAMGYREIIDALSLGTRNMLATGILLVTVGIVVGVINMTGTSIAFSQLVVDWSGNSTLVAIALITGASLLLGMGLPVTAAYVMTAILTVPALESMGVSLLAAHMIIFWLSQDSNVTPPVCLAAFAASSIAGSRPMLTGVTSWKLAKGLYIMPLLFAFTLLINGTWPERFTVAAFSMAGLFAFSACLANFMFRPINYVARGILILCTIGLFWPNNIIMNLLGLILLIILGLTNYFSGKTERNST